MGVRERHVGLRLQPGGGLRAQRRVNAKAMAIRFWGSISTQGKNKIFLKKQKKKYLTI